MLTSLRKSAASWLAKVLFGLLILSFAVWGIGDYLSPEVRTAVATVGETEIDSENFRRDYNRSLDGLRRRMGGVIPPDMAARIGLPEQVLEGSIQRRLIDLEARTLGLAIGDGIVRQRIETDETFHGRLGGFDRDLFERTLFSNGLTEGDFVSMLRGNIARRQVDEAVRQGARAPTALAAALYRYREETRTLSVLRVPRASAEAPPEPTDSDLREHYGENRGAFMAPEYRKVALVLLDPEKWLDKVSVGPEAVAGEYEDRIADFTSPESRRVRQLLFAEEEKAGTAMERLRTGAAIGDVADGFGLEVSDLGAVTAEQLPDSALEEAVFGVGAPGPVGPVGSPLGWHVLAVEEIRPEVVTPLEDVREELRRTLAREIAVGRLAELSNDLDDELGGGATLEEAARGLGLEVAAIAAVDRSGLDPEGEPVEGLPRDESLFAAIFNAPRGETGLLQDLGDGGYFVLRVDGVTVSAPRAFDQAKPDVREAWLAAETDRRIRVRADGIADALRAGRPRSEAAPGLAAETTGPLRRDGIDHAQGISAALLEAVFRAGKGDTVVAPVPEGYAVATVDDIDTPDPSVAAEDVALIREGLSVGTADDVAYQYSRALRLRYGVTIDRDLLATYN